MNNSTKNKQGMRIAPFVCLYIIPMLLTYTVRWVAFSLSADTGFQDGPNVGGIFIWLVILYSIMIFATVRRARANHKGWMVVLPIIGAVFDIFLGFVPLIPTIMNILVLIFGCMEPQSPREIIIRESSAPHASLASTQQD